jgi:hypothetical protein
MEYDLKGVAITMVKMTDPNDGKTIIYLMHFIQGQMVVVHGMVINGNFILNIFK